MFVIFFFLEKMSEASAAAAIELIDFDKISSMKNVVLWLDASLKLQTLMTYLQKLLIGQFLHEKYMFLVTLFGDL